MQLEQNQLFLERAGRGNSRGFCYVLRAAMASGGRRRGDSSGAGYDFGVSGEVEGIGLPFQKRSQFSTEVNVRACMRSM